METNFLLNVRITDFKMAAMVNEHFQLELKSRHLVRTTICRVRNKLKILWRLAFVVQALTPSHVEQKIFDTRMLGAPQGGVGSGVR